MEVRIDWHQIKVGLNFRLGKNIGSNYGSGTIAGSDGRREITAAELKVYIFKLFIRIHKYIKVIYIQFIAICFKGGRGPRYGVNMCVTHFNFYILRFYKRVRFRVSASSPKEHLKVLAMCFQSNELKFYIKSMIVFLFYI